MVSAEMQEDLGRRHFDKYAGLLAGMTAFPLCGNDKGHPPQQEEDWPQHL